MYGFTGMFRPPGMNNMPPTSVPCSYKVDKRASLVFVFDELSVCKPCYSRRWRTNEITTFLFGSLSNLRLIDKDVSGANQSHSKRKVEQCVCVCVRLCVDAPRFPCSFLTALCHTFSYI